MRTVVEVTVYVSLLAALTAGCGGGGGDKDVAAAGDAAEEGKLEVAADAAMPDAVEETAPDAAEEAEPEDDVPELADDRVTPDVPVDAAGEELTPDGAAEEVEPEVLADDTDGAGEITFATGTISIAGTLSLAPPLPAMGPQGGGYILGLLPANYQFEEGKDPGADLMAANILPTGAEYQGEPAELPADGLTLMKWDPTVGENGNPLTNIPFETEAGEFTLVIAFMPAFGGEGDPTHFSFGPLVAETVPWLEDIGETTLQSQQ